MKTKLNKKIIAIGLFITMFALYGVFPMPDEAKAVNSLKDASDTISDSELGATEVTHFITFETATEIPAGGYTKVTFDEADTEITLSNGDAGNITCSDSGTASYPSATEAQCLYPGIITASSTLTIEVASTTNPGTEDLAAKRIDIETFDNGDVLLDRVSVMVYFIDDVLMTATVDPILTFDIAGVDGGGTTLVNNIPCNATTTATSTPFGTLVVNATTTVCQVLTVQTNADDGYTVTVEQDQELTSDSGSNINSFDNSEDGTGSSTAALAHTWVSPNNVLDEYHTYGHMGFTSNDQDLNTLSGGAYANYYNGGGVPLYTGFNNTEPVVVLHHDGPADGTTQNVSVATVAYSAEIASLQEAGDYENTLTYIVTPVY